MSWEFLRVSSARWGFCFSVRGLIWTARSPSLFLSLTFSVFWLSFGSLCFLIAPNCLITISNEQFWRSERVVNWSINHSGGTFIWHLSLIDGALTKYCSKPRHDIAGSSWLVPLLLLLLYCHSHDAVKEKLSGLESGQEQNKLNSFCLCFCACPLYLCVCVFSIESAFSSWR